MIEHAWKHTAGAAGRSCHDGTSGCVLLAHGKRIGENESTGAKNILIALGTDEIRGCLTAQMQRSRKHALAVKSTLNGLLHHLPDFKQIVVDVPILDFLDIFPIGLPVAVAPAEKFRHRIKRIDVRRLDTRQLVAADSPSADAVKRPFVAQLPIIVHCCNCHGVRMLVHKHLWKPLNLHRSGL